MNRPEIVSAVSEVTGCHGYRCGDYSMFPRANNPFQVGEYTPWGVAGPGVARIFSGPEMFGDAMAFLRACADAAADKAVCERIAAEHEGYAAAARDNAEPSARSHEEEAARHRRQAARALTPEALDRRLAESLRCSASYVAAFGRRDEANELEERARRFRDSLVRRMVASSSSLAAERSS